MGSVSVQITTFYAEISANSKAGWFWNNPPQDSVFSFSAVPTGGDNPPNTWFGLQIVDLDYAHISAPDNKPGSKRRVRFKVYNPNPFKVTYEIHTCVASP